ncbi:MAG: DUF1592 domain-containing protein [Aureliella sp.]
MISESAIAVDPASKQVIASYCLDCHSGSEPDGGLDLETLSHDLKSESTFATWERVYDRIVAREMPPIEFEALRDDDFATIQAGLFESLNRAHEATKGTVLRRLNRIEYTNTLNDIFGTNVDLASGLPEDGRTHEFDTVGASLSISMSQLQQYLDSIDRVMDAAIVQSLGPPPQKLTTTNYAETREAKKFIGDIWKQLADGAVVFFRDGGYPSGMLRTASASEDGYYRVKITGYAYQSEKPITFAVGATTFQRGLPRPTFAYHSFAPGEPQSLELRVWLPERYMLEITPWGIRDENYELKDGGIVDYQGPGLAIGQVELEGPITDKFPSRGHKLLFDGLDRREVMPSNAGSRTKSWYKPQFELAVDDLDAAVGRGLVRIASEALRRDVELNEVARYRELFRKQLAAGDEPEIAYRTAVAAVFCSPDFLFLGEQAGPLNGNALASRLSYMLHRTRPDSSLRKAARDGSLTEPSTLALHARRLMRQPEFQRFIDDFTDSWLNLRDIDFTTPDQTLFPEFDAFLQFSMIQETRHYFRELLERDLSIEHVVQSDFAMLNNRLAMHYGIGGVDGPEIRRVVLPADSVRGGFLGQASILKVSANGTNTSPVVRGVWVNERILGEYPPPPPAGVNGVEPDIRGASTLRELLDKHRDSDSCRNCHAKIDPPGFALESFNPIGGWRDRFRSLGGGDAVKRRVNRRPVRYKLGPTVDASGNLAQCGSFSGFTEFRQLLVEQEVKLAAAYTSKLLTFATGREMGFSDRAVINSIAKRAVAKNLGMKGILLEAIQSPIFRFK